MAVALEFIDFIVPVSLVKTKYPGGWEAFLDDYGYAIGRRVWFDDHLVRDGAMNPQDIKALVDEWSAKGFEPMGQRDGKPYWKDCCVVEHMFGGPTLPCDWLEFDPKGVAYLKGTEPGSVVGPAER